MSELEALAAKVALMRQLGVTECDGIKLGAPILPPPAEETKEQFAERVNRAAAKRHAIMFAASGTRPKLVKVT